MTKLEKLFLIFLLLLSFGIRLIFLIEVSDSPFLMTNLLNGTDMARYIKLGISIASGDWIGKETYWQAPLFPYMLGCIFKFSGFRIYTACLIQTILSAFTCILIYGITREAFGRKIAWISSLISCFYGPFIFYSAVLLSETLGIFLISLALFCILVSLRKPCKSIFFISGIIFGLASLTRPNFLIFFPLILLTLLMKKIKIVPLFLMFCAGLAITITPVTARNYIVSGRVIFISANAFETFRLANSYDSSVLNFCYPESAMMPIASIAFWKHQLQKAIFFWWGYEMPQNVNYYLWMEHIKVLRLPLFSFWLVAPLSIAGIAISFAKRNANPVLYFYVLSYYLSVVIFYIVSRFRLPVMAGLIPFAGLCLFYLYEWLRQRRYGKFILCCIMISVLMAIMVPWRVERITTNDRNMLRKAVKIKEIYR